MSILTILEFPDERLRKVATPVEAIDSMRSRLIDDMFETMYESNGIGLAATQIDFHERIIVMDTSEEKDAPFCLVNPEILEQEGTEVSEEGCLSVPGFFEKVERAEKVVVSALNRDGDAFELSAEGMLAVCIQHEMDHLSGKLFVDYLSPLKRQRIKKKMEKIHKTYRSRNQ
ncbi:MAG: peptide deformylase [Methylococcales bacterium]|nr:peptide deformylase [Methylococcaceae bacterium]HIL41706.1 peptide deformylase [Methylococcales bacterium]